jgi:hypothetical protein
MITPAIVQLLLDKGFTDGWALSGDVLILWEHDTDPPAPLTRPTETEDEAVTTDADAGTSAD